MNSEFHFYITHLLAKRAGFQEEESYIIAYSSQYVDDNCLIYTINQGSEEAYENYISQTINILKPKPKLMRIYSCFHFVPGEYNSELAKRKDGKMHILNTTPNNSQANVLIDMALSTENLYRIGIATHSYADTWAHQNFVGYFDYFNGMGGLFERISPNIGHADVQNYPDIPGLIWQDKRLISRNNEIRNKKRFIEAAENVFKKYSSLKLQHALSPDELNQRWEQLKEEIEWAIGREFAGKDIECRKRMARYRELLGDFRDYDDDEWFNEAVKTKVVAWPDNHGYSPLIATKMFPDKYYKKAGFENSHWFKFQEAIKEHQQLAENLYASLFNQMEVEEY